MIGNFKTTYKESVANVTVKTTSSTITIEDTLKLIKGTNHYWINLTNLDPNDSKDPETQRIENGN